MHTLATTRTCRHARLSVTTLRPTEFVDLTQHVNALVVEAGLQTGLVHVQSLHTTTAIVVNEHEPLLLDDFAALLANAAPPDAAYRHDDMGARTVNLAPGERANGHAHCRALLLASSVSLNLADGHRQLGRWQRVFLVALDGPRARDVSVLVHDEGMR
jgi:secondary thiamine-phosphate synthase enzyme